MRVHLKIQWGYTFFLTWHCETNYFKYKLCLVYSYMESYLFMILWSTRNPSECPLVFFFLLKRVGRRGAQPNSSSGPWKSLHATFFCYTTIQPCVLCCPCMFYAAFIFHFLAKWCGCGVFVRFNRPFRLVEHTRLFLTCGEETRGRHISAPTLAWYLLGNEGLFSFDLMCMVLDLTGDTPPRRNAWLWKSLRNWVCNAVVSVFSISKQSLSNTHAIFRIRSPSQSWFWSQTGSFIIKRWSNPAAQYI